VEAAKQKQNEQVQGSNFNLYGNNQDKGVINATLLH
jgi:hypothetical protein